LDWSLSLCSEVEVAVLRRMAVFAGPVGLDAIIAVGGGDLLPPEAVIDALVGLVDKSLVALRRREQPSYDLLVTIRQAALARLLAAAERDEALSRHARWVLDRCRAAAPGGLERDTSAVRELAVEIEAALERGLAGEISIEDYLGLTLTLRDHFFSRAQHLGIRHGLHLATQDIADGARAHCLNTAAKAMLEIRHPDFAATTQAAIEVARECGDTEALARGLLAVAEIDLLSSPQLTDEGITALRESMQLMAEVADTSPRCELHLLVARGWLAHCDGDFATAAEWHRQCLEVSRARGSRFIEATARFNLAEVAELGGDAWRAVEEYGLAAETSLALDGFVSAADALLQATRLLVTAEDFEAALEYAADTVLAARRSRSEQLLVAALVAQSDAATAAGDQPTAQRARREAQAIEASSRSAPAHAV
jgi:tetratricopeptide (TPR) repeat protein